MYSVKYAVKVFAIPAECVVFNTRCISKHTLIALQCPSPFRKTSFGHRTRGQTTTKFILPVQGEGLLVRAKSKEEGIFVGRFLRELVLRNLQTQALLFQKTLDRRSPPFIVISESAQSYKQTIEGTRNRMEANVSFR